jgi:hypothetical protein
MAKKLTIELTPTQARALVWAVNIFEASYEGDGCGFDDMNRAAMRAVRSLEKAYFAADDYAVANGK